MLAMSAKLVPVWSVTIPPSLIGVPVAATPGLAPHCDVLDVLTAGALVAVVVPAELELPQAASTMDVTSIAVGPTARRSAR
jgi:hypothetical protein